ncbi:MAG: TetR/AcrR family transcriptional regulator [Candidatus Margulisbacteria bacterium]|jgi:AcrR family transcriptional regulator|nr:TetR/AcrR family transcriptional regulator [Candidatus Margulisiibacteriota bacterium]
MENNKETKQKLIDAALKLFKDPGYQDLTIEQLCETVGISKNTYYYYFESKEALLLACIGEQKTLTMQELSKILLSEPNHFEQLWLLYKKRIDFVMGCGASFLRGLHSIKAIQCMDGAVKDKHEMLEIEIDIIRKAQDAGEVRNKSEARALTVATGMQFMGVLLVWVFWDGKFDLAEIFRSALEATFDVPPEARQGGDLYAQSMSAMQLK